MDLVDALVLKDLKGVGDDTLNTLLQFSELNSLHYLEDLAKLESPRLPLKKVPTSLDKLLMEGKFDPDRSSINEKVLSWKELGIDVLVRGNPDYPAQLLDLPKPPPILFCKGNLELLIALKAIAVVGTRENTRKGEQIATKTVEHFAKHGFSIVSGLALGIDTIAHRAALDVNAPTVAVLVDLVTVSPSSNRALADEILEKGGLWISENPPGTRAIPAFFAKRDRIQAGLSSAVFAIETSVDGGTMYAVKASHSIKRPVYVPDAAAAGYADLSIRAISGTQKLVRDGLAMPYTRDSYQTITSRLEAIAASFEHPSQDERLL